MAKKCNSKNSRCNNNKYLFTSESVTMGHPDKVADGISDAILDAMLAQDPKSRVACETMVTTGMVIVAGEITSKAIVDITNVDILAASSGAKISTIILEHQLSVGGTWANVGSYPTNWVDLDNSIKIELLETGPGLSENAEYLRTSKKKGILRWDMNLEPDSFDQKATVVNYSFTMEYDKNMQIQPRRANR